MWSTSKKIFDHHDRLRSWSQSRPLHEDDHVISRGDHVQEYARDRREHEEQHANGSPVAHS